jgi:hypothetical protein
MQNIENIKIEKFGKHIYIYIKRERERERERERAMSGVVLHLG